MATFYFIAFYGWRPYFVTLINAREASFIGQELLNNSKLLLGFTVSFSGCYAESTRYSTRLNEKLSWLVNQNELKGRVRNVSSRTILTEIYLPSTTTQRHNKDDYRATDSSTTSFTTFRRQSASPKNAPQLEKGAGSTCKKSLRRKNSATTSRSTLHDQRSMLNTINAP